MILNTFQLPKIIADTVTAKKPVSISNSDRQMKEYIVSILCNSGMYDGRYMADEEIKNIYLHTVEENTTNSHVFYTVSNISRLVGVEPTIDKEYFMAHLNPSPILRFASGNGNPSRLIIMGNAFLRAHFGLSKLKSYGAIKDIMGSEENGNWMSYFNDEVFADAEQFINVSRNLCTLYRDLIEENKEDGFFNVSSDYLGTYPPSLAGFSDYLYSNTMTYVVVAMAIATMKQIYRNIVGMEDDLRAVEKTSMKEAIDSMIALALLDNTFKDKNNYLNEFIEDHQVVSKLVDILLIDGETNKPYIAIVNDLAHGIASVERSIK